MWGLWASTRLASGASISFLTSPLSVAPDMTFDSADAGNGYALLRARTGRLYAAGTDTFCRNCLGSSTTLLGSSCVLPVGEGAWFDIPVVLFSAGTSLAAAVTADQRVWIWGSPRGLVLPSSTPMALPSTQVPDKTEWISLSLGSDTIFLVEAHGSLFVWGPNVAGVACSDLMAMENGFPALAAWNPPQDLARGRIRMVGLSASSDEGQAAESEFSVFVTGSQGRSVLLLFVLTRSLELDEVFTCGAPANLWGQRGIAAVTGSPARVPLSLGPETITLMAVGTAHVVLVTNVSTFIGWGRNDRFQLDNTIANESSVTSPAILSLGVSGTRAVVAGQYWSLGTTLSPAPRAPTFFAFRPPEVESLHSPPLEDAPRPAGSPERSAIGAWAAVLGIGVLFVAISVGLYLRWRTR